MKKSKHVDAKNGSHRATSSSLKEKAIEELKLYWVIAIYLAMMLVAFASYRYLVLSESGTSYYFHAGAAVITALIIAKVIMIGEALGLGRRFEGSRLIISALFKALVFGVFIAIFTVLEHIIEGVVHRESWNEIVQRLLSTGRAETLARTVVAIVTLIPFFAFWETDRVMADHKLFSLFFRNRAL